MNGTLGGERRKHVRLQTREGAYACFFVADTQSIIRFGQIEDISKGGLSFSYLPADSTPFEATHLKLFGRDWDLLLVDQVPCRITYDLEAPDEMMGLLPKRRCGVEFGILSKSQQTQIERFIDRFAAECSINEFDESVSR
jgi:c-di-GMP-binding flagellar brake protein YcgR